VRGLATSVVLAMVKVVNVADCPNGGATDGLLGGEAWVVNRHFQDQRPVSRNAMSRSLKSSGLSQKPRCDGVSHTAARGVPRSGLLEPVTSDDVRHRELGVDACAGHASMLFPPVDCRPISLAPLSI
jgi:hypothetical protein